jgi:hypothetical protein
MEGGGLVGGEWLKTNVPLSIHLAIFLKDTVGVLTTWGRGHAQICSVHFVMVRPSLRLSSRVQAVDEITADFGDSLGREFNLGVVVDLTH